MVQWWVVCHCWQNVPTLISVVNAIICYNFSVLKEINFLLQKGSDIFLLRKLFRWKVEKIENDFPKNLAPMTSDCFARSSQIQRDRTWRKFTTFAKNLKYLKILWGFFGGICSNFNLLAQIFNDLGQIIAKYRNII